ncbi:MULTISPECIES: acyl-homoserine-lactone synthase [unclassified Paracoccus (in: a-proteobacteria)]|uniref:acyl-homoserine-lactone synthase n=1 Tax=unclassified Paracoccus (in: a-proteobacteria) TaxID=2688777 RepID=UPI001601534C|nr:MULTISPECIES: acyl-homoserine-lactone synthase [unclassified Paracoccus (in: a-proteobacteria)]MBB1491081.1 N-acyl-L-homoserine lactone synthetase [Paracoccus sp. MC1854]MBB1497104.1 N-acyl-L-homoserine lactone synthetase [Paracoccus sp. MC1862]QQO44498.1 N-acyl-L-homoserine lactone synthetase [Paracoccus sp. MC1862]
MQTTTLSFSNLHNHGELFANLFRARRQSFIIQKNWDLPQADGMEYDQYDTPASRWVAVHDGVDQVLGGFRLTPTTAQCGIYSYMIRDAQRGVLGGTIPQDLLYGEAPVDPQVWECTRVFVNHETPMAIRRKVHMQMAGAMTRTAREFGATRLIALTGATWPRWYGRCGLDAEAIGRVLLIEGEENQCVSINLVPKMH